MREMGKMLSCLVRKLRDKLKFTDDGSAMSNDSTPVIGVSSLVAGDALLTIDAGSSMVEDTSPTTSDQKRDPTTTVGGPIIEDFILSIDVDSLVTWDTSPTEIVSSLVIKAIALIASSSGLVIEPLVPTALVLSHCFDDLLENFYLSYLTPKNILLTIFIHKNFYI